MIPWWYTELGEEESLQMVEAFSRRRLTLSQSVEQVEEAFSSILDVPYSLMVNSGSSALLMAHLALGIETGDEVIAPSVTWIATAQAPALIGAKVKVCDCRSNSPVIDVDQLKELVTSKTKAIIPVHLNGRECDLEAIQSIANNCGAYVIEDACKALFSRGEKGYLGTIGDVGCYSLGMISIVSVGYGGLVVTRQKDIYERLKKIRDHGVKRNPESYSHLGFNFKISDLLASLALPQLEKIKEKAKKAIALHDFYSENVKHSDISVLPIDKTSGKVPVYAEAYSENREELIDYLLESGIQTSRFHLPVHKASYLKENGSFPNAERFTRNTFILPSGPSQSLEDIAQVVEKLNQFSSSYGVVT